MSFRSRDNFFKNNLQFHVLWINSHVLITQLSMLFTFTEMEKTATSVLKCPEHFQNLENMACNAS